MRDHMRQDSRAIRFIFLMGLVSLFGDVTYEGARSILGPFLALLGAGAATVGFVSGLGEFIGYGLRLVSGYFADRTRRYWLIAILGYGITLLAVPLLAFAGRWEVAAVLVVAERLGKAIRTPARDAMISHAASRVGTGWGFALHEALDQVGAVSGPLLVAGALYLRAHYQTAFGILFIPALLAAAALFTARRLYPDPQALEDAVPPSLSQPAADSRGWRHLPPVFWIYTLFTAVSVAGYAHFQLIAYHAKSLALVPDPQIPVYFALAMGLDALVALVAGRMFDRKGLLTLMALPVLSIPIPFLAFSRSAPALLLGVLLWGGVMGLQETIMRAAIGTMVPSDRRGLAYGVFNSAYGLSWFVGSSLMGVLYGWSISYTVAFAVLLELASIPVLLKVRRLVRVTGANGLEG